MERGLRLPTHRGSAAGFPPPPPKAARPASSVCEGCLKCREMKRAMGRGLRLPTHRGRVAGSDPALYSRAPCLINVRVIGIT